MRAQVITQFGDNTVFQTMELPKPIIKSGHVLIRVLATSVNPIDYKLRAGMLPHITADFPALLHGDVAGAIVEVAADVHDFNVGDEVFGCVGGVKGEGGALAEFILADARLIAKKPISLTMQEAAALPLVCITAWEALFEKVKIKAGQSILIHAGTGGVGHVAIQLAKWAGAKVYTTVSTPEKAAIAKELGADDVIFYRDETVQDYVDRLTAGKGFEIVLDTVGGENLDAAFAAVALYGDVVTIQAASTHDLTSLFLKSANLHVVLMLVPLLHNLQRERFGKIMASIATLADEKKLKPLIDAQRFAFADVGKAHALLESGKAMGKVVIA